MGKTSTPGPDSIPPEIYKNMSHINLQKLLEILNFFWNTGLPSKFKESIIIPIHKVEKPPSLPSSYRPISLTNSLCKIMERMVSLRLKLLLGDTKFFDSKQSGFRAGFSSLDGIARLENSIRKNQQEDRPTIGVFLDINKAFESINHSALLFKIKQSKLNGNLFCFIKNFLSDRKIAVKYKNKISKSLNTTLGVPQGSVISPMLFCYLIFI